MYMDIETKHEHDSRFLTAADNVLRGRGLKLQNGNDMFTVVTVHVQNAVTVWDDWAAASNALQS